MRPFSFRPPDTTSPHAVKPYWRHGLAHLGKAALEFLYPPQCLICERATMTHQGVCAHCWPDLAWITEPCCMRLGTPFSADFGVEMLSPQALADPPKFDRARAAAHHTGAAKALVNMMKYGNRPHLALPMAQWMLQPGRTLLAEADLILPVPMHVTRLWRRGYNQAAMLADALGRLAGKPALLEGVERIRRTPAQAGLKRAQRQKNLEGAFAINPAMYDLIAGKNLLMIDDVRTTGSTLNALAHHLRKAGAARIDALTFTLVVAGEENH